METSLKQRLVGASVLVALAVIFLPMLVKGPAPDSGVSDVSLDIPAEPKGDPATNTVDLPLIPAAGAPSGGVVGMPAASQDENATAAPADAGAFPTVAAGDYVVSFGSYATAADAQQVIAALRNAGLPAFSEATKVGTRDAQRVRIGPFADRAIAESARLTAAKVNSGVDAKVVVLDVNPTGPVAAAPSVSAQAPARVAVAPTPAAAKPEPLPPVAKPVSPPVASVLKPVATTPASAAKPPVTAPAPTPVAKPAVDTSKTGFAVQVGAFADTAAATALRDKLRGAGFNTFTDTVNTDGGMRTRVRVGPVVNRAEADALNASVKAKTGLSGMVRPHP
ncbi:MAG: SPOR domain-containing protein [Thermomonas sp.]